MRGWSKVCDYAGSSFLLKIACAGIQAACDTEHNALVNDHLTKCV
jgi:hypothetical protein